MKNVLTGLKSKHAKSTVLAILLALNICLVGAIIYRHTPENKAQAAIGGRVGDVLAVPGNLPGYSDGVVFLLDTSNKVFTAISVDTGNRAGVIQSMPPLDIDRLLAAPAPVRPK